jgi:hypothetical protein
LHKFNPSWPLLFSVKRTRALISHARRYVRATYMVHMLAAIYIYIYAEVLDQGEPLSTLNFVQCVLKFCRVAIFTDNPKLLWYESITGDMYRSESREYRGAA